MGGKNCSYKGCKNDNRYKHKAYMEGIFFLPFPKPKTQLSKCKRWIAACSRPELLTLEKINSNRYVCSFHFLGGAGPTDANPDPIPYHDFCVDDTHLSCKTEELLIESNSSDSRLNSEETLLAIEKPSLGATETAVFSVSEPILSVSERSDHSLRTDETSPNVIESRSSSVNETRSHHFDDPSLNGVNDHSVSPGELGFVINNPNLSNDECEVGDYKPSLYVSPIAIANRDVLRKELLSSVITDATDLLKKFIENLAFISVEELKWTISRNEDSSLSIFKMNSPHICAIEIKINLKLELEIYVYGKPISKDSSIMKIEIIPETISKLSDLINFLDYINLLTICNGTSFNSGAGETNYNEKLGFINIYTRTLYSRNCDGLVENKMNQRCQSCKTFRSSLIAKQKRAKLNPLSVKKGRRTYRSMSRDNLAAALTVKTRQNRAKDQRIKTLKQTIKTLKQSLSEETNVLCGEPVNDEYFCSKENFLRILLKEQLKLIKYNRNKPKKWHPAIIKWCLYLRAKSSSAYETLREVLTLPARRTLWKYTSVFTSQSGVTTEAVNEMKGKIDLASADEHQKYFSPIVDEMKIKEELI